MRFLLLSLSCMVVFSCNSNFMSKADFVEKCRTALIAKCPALQVTVINKQTLFIENSGKRDNVTVKPFYREYAAAPNAVDSAVQHFINSTGLVSDQGAKIDLARVVPVVKPLSCLVNGPKEQAFPLVNEPYNEQLVILYAVERKEGLSFITNAAFESLGISKDSLKNRAYNNYYNALLPKIKEKKSESGNAYLLTAESQYVAGMILFPPLWVRQHVDVKGNIIMGIPYPDMLYVAGSEDAAGIEWIKQEMKSVHMGGVQRISTDLFSWKGDRFIKY